MLARTFFSASSSMWASTSISLSPLGRLKLLGRSSGPISAKRDSTLGAPMTSSILRMSSGVWGT